MKSTVRPSTFFQLRRVSPFLSGCSFFILQNVREYASLFGLNSSASSLHPTRPRLFPTAIHLSVKTSPQRCHSPADPPPGVSALPHKLVVFSLTLRLSLSATDENGRCASRGQPHHPRLPHPGLPTTHSCLQKPLHDTLGKHLHTLSRCKNGCFSILNLLFLLHITYVLF